MSVPTDDSLFAAPVVLIGTGLGEIGFLYPAGLLVASAFAWTLLSRRRNHAWGLFREICENAGTSSCHRFVHSLRIFYVRTIAFESGPFATTRQPKTACHRRKISMHRKYPKACRSRSDCPFISAGILHRHNDEGVPMNEQRDRSRLGLRSAGANESTCTRTLSAGSLEFSRWRRVSQASLHGRFGFPECFVRGSIVQLKFTLRPGPGRNRAFAAAMKFLSIQSFALLAFRPLTFIHNPFTSVRALLLSAAHRADVGQTVLYYQVSDCVSMIAVSMAPLPRAFFLAFYRERVSSPAMPNFASA